MPHQELFTWANWPLLVVCLGMIAAAVIDWWKFKVPNRLTFPLILSGWLFGLLNNFGAVPSNAAGGIGAVETFEDVRQRRGGNAFAGIFHGQGNTGGASRAGDGDRAARRSMLDGVVHQDQQNAPNS